MCPVSISVNGIEGKCSLPDGHEGPHTTAMGEGFVSVVTWTQFRP